MLRLAARGEQMAGARHDAREAVRQRWRSRACHRGARAGGPVPAGSERVPAADVSPGQVRRRYMAVESHPRAGCQAEGGPGCPHRPLLP